MECCKNPNCEKYEEFLICINCQKIQKSNLNPKKEDMCCKNQEKKLLNGMWICISCHTVLAPLILGEFHHDKFVRRKKSIYDRTYYVEHKLQNDFGVSYNELKVIMKTWLFIESELKNFNRKRFPNLNFFLIKLLEIMGISNQLSCKLSDKTKSVYESMWEKIVLNITSSNDQKSEGTNQQFDHQ